LTSEAFMNLVIATLKSTAANPSLPDDRREAAVSQLREIAGNPSDSRASDAALVLRKTLYGSVQPPSVPTGKQQAAKSSDPSSPEHPDYFWHLLAKQLDREAAFYEKAQAEGLTAAETVAEMRKEQGIHAAPRYGVIFSQAEVCRRDGAYAARTYFCPIIRQKLEEIEKYAPHDWPAIELAKATLAQYEEEKNRPIL
jgi:hypothetical protein